MAAEYDRGPSQAIASICLRCPLPGKPQAFWTAWGPIFYRGRLDGSARLLCIASDPGPTERIAHRTLVGDAGQRVQGFLAKLGLTKSYLCVNAFPYALHPSWGMSADELLADPAQKEWRNQFYDAVKPDDVQAIVAFGTNAQQALDLWAGKPNVPVERVPHPSSRDAGALLQAWHGAIQRLRAEGDAGSRRARGRAQLRLLVPGGRLRRDPERRPAVRRARLPRRRRRGQARVIRATTTRWRRPTPDDGHTLIWTAPDD